MTPDDPLSLPPPDLESSSPSADGAPAGDPLWRSFERILNFHQVNVDKSLLEAQIAVDWSKKLTPSDILTIGRHLGLEVAVRSIAGIDLAGLTKPALVMKAEAWSFVSLPQQGAVPSLWVPEGEIDFDALRDSRARDLFVMEFDRRAAHLQATSAADASWFWDMLWRHKRDYVDIGLSTFFINLFALVVPLYSMTVFDRVVPNHAHETLLALSIGMFLAYLFNLGFKLVRSHVMNVVTARIATRIDIEFMDHLLRLNVPAQKLSVGERFDLFHELQGLRDFFAGRLLPAVVDLPFFLLFLIVIYSIAPGVSLVVLGGVVALLLTNLGARMATGGRAKAYFREARSKNAVLAEMLAGASTIRLFNATGAMLLKWQGLSDRLGRSGERRQRLASFADELSYMVMSLISMFVIIAGVSEIETGELSVGGLVACNILVSRTLSPIMGLAAVLGKLRQSLDSLKSIDTIFRLKVEPKVTADYAAKGPFTGAMRLQDITFYHPGQVHPTLYHLNLEIRPGELVGIIGRTGAGKSTITRLLDGTVTPQSGYVYVDNLALETVHPAEWRQSLGIVPQDPFFFAGSVRDNILLGVGEAVDEAWLKQVMSMSGLEPLLRQAGYGMDFQVGEGGQRLSGGQRQSLALARALIRKPNILLFDEPTNGMDNDLEQYVMNALRPYLQGRTLVMITHRTPLLAMVNRLVLIDRGAVAADGPTDEMMRRLAGKG